MRFLLSLIFSFAFVLTRAQIAHDYSVSIAGDIIKTDTEGRFNKVQLGAEFNYYVHRRVTVTGGFEYWKVEGPSFVIGTRWYPGDDFFIRARGLVGANDVSLGAGWNKPLGEHFRFEAMGDFYFLGDFAIRAGLTYVFRKKLVSRE